MNFICKELIITDDANFGCTITFTDSIESDNTEKSISEIINPNERFFTIQRSYPEDYDEIDFYHIETSESDTELGYKDQIIFYLNNKSIKIQWCSDEIEIGVDLDKKEIARLKRKIKSRFSERIIFFDETI
ncbi:MAG: hypothetical protein JW717_05100 [Marinilabiliaceae bacterium]|nr:hypothetical protein [Marinilabiliaceae bacterium]